MDENDKLCPFYKELLKLLGINIQRLSTVNINIPLDLQKLNYNYKRNIFSYNSRSILEMLNKQDSDFILFNPLEHSKESYSMLMIEDRINIKLSSYIDVIINGILEIKSTSSSSSDKIQGLEKIPTCDKSTVYKWKNIYKIITATGLSRVLIDYSFTFDNKNNTADIKIEYPLFDILQATKDNIVGITLEKSEIELFIQIYQCFIIDFINDIFKEPITIPVQNNKCFYFYTLIKFHINVIKQIFSKYNLFFNKIHINSLEKKMNDLEININNLNNFIPYDFSEKINKLDKEYYIQEMKTRQETEPNWLLLKDNEMGKKNKQLVAVEDNNIGRIVDNLGNFLGSHNIKLHNKINRFYTDVLLQDYKDNYKTLKNDQEWRDIFYLQNLVLDIIRDSGGALWYDTRIKKYCFRSKLNGNISEVDSKELGDLLTRASKDKIIHYSNNSKYDVLDYAMEIVLVSKLKGINNQKLSINEKSNDIIKILLFENEIKTVDDDAFNVNKNEEFFKDDSDFLYTQNRFIPTEYLIKRYKEDEDIISTSSTEQTFIEKFIYYLVKENRELSAYIVNWLAYYLKNLQKSKTALVLLGNQEVTQGVFWKVIINEIFGKQYCTTINDEEQDTASVSDIAKDKLFFHIGDINNADTKFDDITLAQIVKELIIQSTVTDEDNNEIIIHGQLLITAKNPKPYLKKALSKCTVMEVNDMETILEKLNVEDETELEDMIREDLDNFTDYLFNYDVDDYKATNKIDTVARQQLKENKTTSNINKEDIDKQIDTFIQAIKDKNIDYFKKVKGTKDRKNNDIYEQLVSAFNQDDGYFIGQDLYLYYNAIHEQSFKTNKHLMDKLKDKDDMFKQEVKTLKIQTKDGKEIALFQAQKTTKETGTKELYKINNYTMAKNITIPSGAIQLSSQENITKYSFENEQDISIWKKKIKEKKDKNKAK